MSYVAILMAGKRQGNIDTAFPMFGSFNSYLLDNNVNNILPLLPASYFIYNDNNLIIIAQQVSAVIM